LKVDKKKTEEKQEENIAYFTELHCLLLSFPFRCSQNQTRKKEKLFVLYQPFSLSLDRTKPNQKIKEEILLFSTVPLQITLPSYFISVP